MSNLPATTVQLPAHLAYLAAPGNNFLSVGQSALSGIRAGGHPRISIRQNRWRLIDTQNEERVLPTLELNVMIVDANPSVSKIFYSTGYNPAADDAVAPDCFSDNGVGPSTQAGNPQNQTCATCPHNVFGSRITPAGTKVKACQDSKKLAVLLADEPSNTIYELRVPAASMVNLATLMKQLVSGGVPVPGVVFQLSFDSTADYPKLTFKALSFATPEQAERVKASLGSTAIAEAIGTEDKPIASNRATNIAATPALPQASPVVSNNLLPQTPPVTVAAPAAPEPPKRKKRTTQDVVAQPASPGIFPPGGVAAANPPDQTFTSPSFFPNAKPRQGTDIPHTIPAAAAVETKPKMTDSALDELLKGALQ